MKLPNELRLELEKELRYTSDKIIGEEGISRKVFFYGAAVAATHRIIEMCYEPELVLLDMVLEVSCSIINERVEDIIQEKNTAIELIDGFFDKLAQAVGDLAECIKSGKSTYKIMETIVMLAHTTTGTGYYLYTKGLVKV